MANQGGVTEPSIQVVEAVAQKEGVEPRELPMQLYEVIDPDALDTIFSDDRSPHGRPTEVRFQYCGYLVTVDEAGVTTVTDQQEPVMEANQRVENDS